MSWHTGEKSSKTCPPTRTVEAVRGKLKLNIELKFYGHNQQLEAEVVRIVQEMAFSDECVVTSLKYHAVQQVGQLDPGLRSGLILAARVGDAARFDVDLVAVNAQVVTRDLVTRVHRANPMVIFISWLFPAARFACSRPTDSQTICLDTWEALVPSEDPL